MTPVRPFVSIIVVNWNGMAHTPACVDSLLRSRYPNFEVIVSDNGSTDSSAEAVEQKFPDAILHRTGANLGFGAAVMAALPRAKGSYIAVLNNDLTVEEDWLANLVDAALSGSYHAVASLILLEDKPTHVNGAGGEMNFLGLAWPRFYGAPATDVPPGTQEVTFCAGGVTLYERAAFEAVGGFDPSFFIYIEDVDLSWRLRLAGYACALAPNARLRHDWDFNRNPRKMYHIERNRLIMIKRNWSPGARALLWPAHALLNAAIWSGAISQGWAKEKSRASRDARAALSDARSRPPLRRVPEWQVARAFRGGIHYAQVSNPAVRFLLNPVLAAYWWMVKPLLRFTRH